MPMFSHMQNIYFFSQHSLCMYIYFQIDVIDFAKRLTSWTEQGFPDLGDDCSPGVCSQVRSIIGHPQFSESPHRVSRLIDP